MSLKDRLSKKTGDLSLASPNKTEAEKGSGPRTAPGQMLAFRSAMRENNDRVTELEAQLKVFEGSSPTKMLNASEIRPSKWANRHVSSFSDSDFEELKTLIAQTNGNTQPIKVRPAQDGMGGYELVFGHRRHRACLELGLPVLAMIDELLSEQQQFVQMDQENRARKNLSAWEQGVWYKKALTEKLWPSQNSMAQACGLSQGNISSALLVADLPSEIIGAFPSPHDIQFTMARKLAAALKENGADILDRARKISLDERRTAASVMSALLSSEGVAASANTTNAVVVERKGAVVSIRARAPDLSVSDLDELKALVSGFIKNKNGE